MDEFLEAVASAIRRQSARGRTYGQLAVELKVSRRTVAHIVQGDRGIGVRTLGLIMKADPPWLREVLAGAPPWVRGQRGRRSAGRPN